MAHTRLPGKRYHKLRQHSGQAGRQTKTKRQKDTDRETDRQIDKQNEN